MRFALYRFTNLPHSFQPPPAPSASRRDDSGKDGDRSEPNGKRKPKGYQANKPRESGNFERQKTMIASNYIKYPEALRFQVEMFSNGYKNSPRIMRLMTVIFKQIADVPGWVKEAAAAAKRLVKMWKAAQIGLNFKAPAHVYQCPNGFLPSLQAKPFSQTGSRETPNEMRCGRRGQERPG